MKEIEILSDVLSSAPVTKLFVPSSFFDLIEMSCTNFTSILGLLYNIIVVYEEIQLNYLQLAIQEADEARIYFKCTWEMYQAMN
eukprot:snap_masked-scaffold_21-processed-gene-2.34-mRNA-1 protein AED:1.00 eAED:1.00 QI:0/0/0/0/1/1/2/0/83